MDAYRNRMALMHSMQSGSTSLEAALERLLERTGEQKPVGTDPHAALLRRFSKRSNGSRPALLDIALFSALDEARRFRHLARKSYDDLDVNRARPALNAAKLIVAEMETAISTFKTALEQKPRRP